MSIEMLESYCITPGDERKIKDCAKFFVKANANLELHHVPDDLCQLKIEIEGLRIDLEQTAVRVIERNDTFGVVCVLVSKSGQSLAIWTYRFTLRLPRRISKRTAEKASIAIMNFNLASDIKEFLEAKKTHEEILPVSFKYPKQGEFKGIWARACVEAKNNCEYGYYGVRIPERPQLDDCDINVRCEREYSLAPVHGFGSATHQAAIQAIGRQKANQVIKLLPDGNYPLSKLDEILAYHKRFRQIVPEQLDAHLIPDLANMVCGFLGF